MALHVAAGRPRRSLDWRRAARLFATGTQAATIAAGMGIEEEYFWRHLARSARFRRFVSSAVYGVPDRQDDLVNLVTKRAQIDSE